MIESFRHKGLKAFAETGDKRGILPGHAERIEEILSALESAGSLRDVLRVKGFHSLRIRGDKRPTRYAMSVSGAWRITFTAHEKKGAVAGESRFRDLNYCNYH